MAKECAEIADWRGRCGIAVIIHYNLEAGLNSFRLVANALQ